MFNWSESEYSVVSFFMENFILGGLSMLVILPVKVGLMLAVAVSVAARLDAVRMAISSRAACLLMLFPYNNEVVFVIKGFL